MALTVLLCTDGSDLATAALRRGLEVVGTPDRLVIATALEPVDATLVVGTGLAGGVMSPEEAAAYGEERAAAARDALDRAVTELGVAGAETVVVPGEPGRAICELAEALPASVVVVGTRGHGGLRRAVLGSVSDHVVRNAPCPVVTVGPD